jgi:hypothetical protein
MLPDFATMCQARLAPPADPEVAAGVDHHHRADAAFHRLPGFLALYRDAEARLRRAGAGRGPARGAAHVAIELFLDGELVRDQEVADGYLAALDRGAPDRRAGFDLDGWHRLHARLAERGAPHGYRDPALVAEIVVRILAPRRYLAPSANDAAVIRGELPRIRERTAAEAGAIMDALRTRLDPA